MKTAFFSEIGKVELREAPEPKLTHADWVKVRLVNTGICGSDVLGLCGGHPKRMPPLVSGHESSGIVVETGAAVTGFKRGDRVAIEPQFGCGRCPCCLEGQYNLCPNKTVLGTAGWSGSFAEYITAPGSTLFRLPDNIPFEQGALLEPLAVGMHAARKSGVGPGKTAVVIGGGPIGLACMLGCRVCGAGRVIVLDMLEYNLGVAKQMGADETVNVGKENVVKRLLELTSGHGADSVFISAGAPQAILESAEMARPGGSLMLLAHFGHKPPGFDAGVFRAKGLSMTGTVMFTREDYEACVQALSSGSIDPAPMITKIFPLDDCAAAFELAQNRSENFIKLMFKM